MTATGYIFFIGFFLALPVLAGLALGWRIILDTHRSSMDNEVVERQRRLTRFEADNLGNYVAYYNPKTGQSFVLPPGNRAHPEQIIMVNGQVKPLENINGRPFNVILNNGHSLPGKKDEQKKLAEQKEPVTGDYRDIEPEQLPREVEPAALPEPEPARTIEQNKDILRELKRNRGQKVESILMVSGVKSRSSKTYQFYSEFWDSIE
jgi:hypothetical protein